MNIIEQASAIREAMDYAGANLTEEQALVCVRLYRAYEVGHSYKTDDYFTYGTNSVGDPQLYRVVQDHTSQADWRPDITPSLYTQIGLDNEGYPVWSQPTGAHDAYNNGDIVNYKGVLYQSTTDGNVWEPGVYGWEIYEQ